MFDALGIQLMFEQFALLLAVGFPLHAHP